jgi:hypothetical protein
MYEPKIGEVFIGARAKFTQHPTDTLYVVKAARLATDGALSCNGCCLKMTDDCYKVSCMSKFREDKRSIRIEPAKPRRIK